MKRSSLLSVLASLLLFTSSAVFAQNTLTAGQQLTTGQVLYSSNNAFYAVMQTDGNFVVYKTGGGATWATSTVGSGAVRAVMQTDGNFVLYTASNQPVWSSNTEGNPGSYFFVDGSGWGGVWIYKVEATWASNTSDGQNPPNDAPTIFQQGQQLPMGQDYYQANGEFDFRFQTDGNLVLYKNGAAIWASNTSDKGVVKAVIENGGINLLDASGNVVWRTGGGGDGYLAFQADGNVVYYAPIEVWGDGPPGKSNSGNCYGDPDACAVPWTIPITIPVD
jgi:hypothetical protein